VREDGPGGAGPEVLRAFPEDSTAEWQRSEAAEKRQDEQTKAKDPQIARDYDDCPNDYPKSVLRAPSVIMCMCACGYTIGLQLLCETESLPHAVAALVQRFKEMPRVNFLIPSTKPSATHCDGRPGCWTASALPLSSTGFTVETTSAAQSSTPTNFHTSLAGTTDREQSDSTPSKNSERTVCRTCHNAALWCAPGLWLRTTTSLYRSSDKQQPWRKIREHRGSPRRRSRSNTSTLRLTTTTLSSAAVSWGINVRAAKRSSKRSRWGWRERTDREITSQCSGWS